jgi:hypothetical protein
VRRDEGDGQVAAGLVVLGNVFGRLGIGRKTLHLRVEQGVLGGAARTAVHFLGIVEGLSAQFPDVASCVITGMEGF